jgi:hypothetical protein
MIRSDRWLYLLILLLVFAHVVYSVFERNNLQGSYFSYGIVLFENGDLLPQSSRLQFQKNTVYDFQQINGAATLLPLKIKNGFQGNFSLKTIQQTQSLNKVISEYAKSQLAYNQAYYAKGQMPLTLYKIPTETKNYCAYIVELQKLRCFGTAYSGMQLYD